jgi:hypothetical protein
MTTQYLQVIGLGMDISEVDLELNNQPAIFRDLERAGLKIGVSNDEGVEVSVWALSALGATLFLEYYPNEEDQLPFVFNGNIFIPSHQLVCINSLHRDVVSLAHASVTAKREQ